MTPWEGTVLVRSQQPQKPRSGAGNSGGGRAAHRVGARRVDQDAVEASFEQRVELVRRDCADARDAEPRTVLRHAFEAGGIDV